MKKYAIFVSYSLRDKHYTETVHLECTRKLYNTPEEAINAISDEIKSNYDNNQYSDLTIKLPKVKHYEDFIELRNGYFECSYIFGPYIHYDIYLIEYND